MRILYVLSGTTLTGGATKSFVTMLEAVVGAGHDVAVVCNDEDGVTEYLKSIKVRTVVTPYRFAAFPSLSFTARDILRFIPRFVRDRIINRRAGKKVLEFSRDFKPDIIHENTSVTGVGSYVARHLGIPLIIHIREYADKDFRIYLLDYRKRLRRENVYPVAITKDLASYRCDSLDEGKKARVIYNGIIDGDSICPPVEKQPYLLYAGRIEPLKGIEDLIDAYILYRKSLSDVSPFLQLKIAGECSEDKVSFLDRLKRKIASAGYEGDVEWLGQCMEMNDLYSKAAATVIPSKFEGFGRIPPEAMAMGSLCVMRDAGGLKEQLDNGVEITGGEIALRFTATEELAQLLTQIAADFLNRKQSESYYAAMIARAQQTVRRLYTKKAYTDSILQLYEEISVGKAIVNDNKKS